MRLLPTAAVATVAAATIGLAAAPAFADGTTTASTPAAAATPATVTPAGADATDAHTPQTLPEIQAAASRAISLRVATLTKLATAVQAAKDLGSDQATLLGTIQRDIPSLQALGAKIAADTTVTTAGSDYQDIFTQYRVYRLVMPVAHMVAESDRISTRLPKLTTAGQKLTAHESSTDSAQVAPLLSDLGAKVAAATSANSGVSSALLAVTPAEIDSDAAALDAAKASLTTARTDEKAAVTDAKTAHADEKAAGGGRHHGAKGSTTTTGPATASPATTPAPAPAG